MTETNALALRIDTLETIVAFQEKTIEELNQALAAQWSELEALKREFARLGSQLRDVEAHPALAPGTEPPPPHY